MILLRHITILPSQYRSREKKVREVAFQRVDTKVEANSVTFTGTTAKSKHTTEIKVELIDRRITPQSPVKIRCNCESFTYEFLFTAHKNKGLLGTLPKLPAGVQTKPKQKNPYSVVGMCKHGVKLAQYITTQRGKTF